MTNRRRGGRRNVFFEGEELSEAGLRLLRIARTESFSYLKLSQRFRCSEETVRNAFKFMTEKGLLPERPKSAGHWG